MIQKIQRSRIFAVLALVLLLVVQVLPAFAAESGAGQLVNDTAGILTEEQAAELEARAKAIQSEYGLDVAIVTVPYMAGSSDAREYAKLLYDQYSIGTGSERSGILLMLSMQYRDYALIAHGEGNQVLTDYGNEKMADSFLDYFRDDDWAGGFDDYLDTANDYCHDYYVDGEAYDVSLARTFGKICLLLAVVGAPLIGALTVGVMINSMKTARRQTHAEYYVDHEHGGLVLSDQSDDYIYSQTIVTHRPKMDNDGGGFGGGTTIDAGGFSGSSGKF